MVRGWRSPTLCWPIFSYHPFQNPNYLGDYHCHHKHYRPENFLSELFPAILDRIITGNYSKRINLIVIRAHYRNHLAVHRCHDTRTEIPWTKSCNELPDDNSPTIKSAIFDRNITGENSQWITIGAKMITCRKNCFEQLIFELHRITVHPSWFARINFRL